jgi:hypothetical protein
MTANKNSCHTGSALIGFVPTMIGADGKIYDRVTFSCPPTNTSPVRIGPATNDLQYQIWPGRELTLQVDDSRFWAVSDDVEQEIVWVQA